MKKLIYLLILIVPTVFISCKNTEKTADSTPPPPPATQQSEPASDKPANDDAKASRDNNLNNKSLTGADIVSKVSSSMSRLEVNGEQMDKIRTYLSDAFTAAGGKLEEKYDGNQAKELSASMLRGAQSNILSILNHTQKDKFNQFVNKMNQ